MNLFRGRRVIVVGRLDSPVARPHIYRPRRLNSPYKSKTTVQSKIDPEWVKGLENRRVDAETKLAEAALIMAESTRAQAEAAKVQADTMRSLVAGPFTVIVYMLYIYNAWCRLYTKLFAMELRVRCGLRVVFRTCVLKFYMNM
ncbi:unnamed protein product, partial [Brenthis ino]